MRELESINNLGQMDGDFKGRSLSNIEDCSLIDCNFIRCMILDIINSSFHGSLFEDCNMRNLQSKHGIFSDINVKTSDISESFIHHSSTKRSGFKKVSFEAAIFKYGEIEDVKYNSCDFTRSVFNGIRFKDVSFNGSYASFAGFRDCTFLACDFSKVKEVSECYFANCNFIECKMPKGFDEELHVERFTLDDLESEPVVRVEKVSFNASEEAVKKTEGASQ